jgi:hypothetical protein
MAATAKGRTRATVTPRPSGRLPEPEGDGELIDIAAPDAEAEPERVPVFSIGGVVHTMLKDPGPAVALRALELADRRGGTPQAVAFADVQIMRDMLGEESYRALLNCSTMTRAQYLKIVDRIMRGALGGLEGEDGSPNR